MKKGSTYNWLALAVFLVPVFSFAQTASKEIDPQIQEMNKDLIVLDQTSVQKDTLAPVDKASPMTNDVVVDDIAPSMTINGGAAGDLTVSQVDTIVQQPKVTADGKYQMIGADKTHLFYPVKDGFEYAIQYDSPPAVDSETFKIDGADNYDFVYQPALTDEEVKAGIVRPDDVVGSYAVFDHFGNKVFHVYRPFLVDALGNKMWATLSYDVVTHELKVSEPPSWMASAAYPVVLDPTFGKTSVGASSDNLPANYWTAVGTYTAASSDTVNSVSVYVNTGTANGVHVTLGIYGDIAGVPVGSPVCSTVEGTVSGVGWMTLATAAPCSVTSGSTYWIGMTHDTSDIYVALDSVSRTLVYKSGVSYTSGVMPSVPVGLTTASTSYDESTYVTYGVASSSSSSSVSSHSGSLIIGENIPIGSLECQHYVPVHGSGAGTCDQFQVFALSDDVNGAMDGMQTVLAWFFEYLSAAVVILFILFHSVKYIARIMWGFHARYRSRNHHE